MSRKCTCKFCKYSNPIVNCIIADLEDLLKKGPAAK